MTRISKTTIKNLRNLFTKQIRDTEYKSVYWVRNFHYSDSLIEFISNTLDDLHEIYFYSDEKLSNDCDTLDVYMCIGFDKKIELVLVFSPIEFFDSDKVVAIHRINASLNIIEEFSFKKIW